MSTRTIAVFNHKGGVGKTSLVYHLAWMYSDLGYRVIAADLDPQANLTSAFLDEERLEEIVFKKNDHKTIFGCFESIIKGKADINELHLDSSDSLETIVNQLALLPSSLSLAELESYLSQLWYESVDNNLNSLKKISSFSRILKRTGTAYKADIILMDLGSNLGAINHTALTAADYVIIPLCLNLIVLVNLRYLGENLLKWQNSWQKILQHNTINYPSFIGRMQPIGYVLWQPPILLDRPTNAYYNLVNDIPTVYQNAVLNVREGEAYSLKDDPNCLAVLKNYQSLMSMAQEAHKPMFHLKPADGAIGSSYTQSVKDIYNNFERLARKIAAKI